MTTFSIIKRTAGVLLRMFPVLAFVGLIVASPPSANAWTRVPGQAMAYDRDTSAAASAGDNVALFPGSALDTGRTFTWLPLNSGAWEGVEPDSAVVQWIVAAPPASGAGNSAVDSLDFDPVLEVGYTYARNPGGIDRTVWVRHDSTTITLADAGQYNSSGLPLTAWANWVFPWHAPGEYMGPAMGGTKGGVKISFRIIYKHGSAAPATSGDSLYVYREEIIPFISGSPPQRGY